MSQLQPTGTLPPKLPLPLRTGFWICMLIGVAVVLRRIFALNPAPASATTSAPPELANLDVWFRTHAPLTYIHILTALVFLCVLPLLFWTRTRRSRPMHVAFYILGAVVGLTAYAMSVYSVGGWIERSAVFVFNTLFLFELAKSLLSWTKQDFVEERRWNLRAAATVLGIATTRPVMGVFFATSRATGLTPQQFFGIAFWIGFSINVLVLELWLRLTRPTQGASF